MFLFQKQRFINEAFNFKIKEKIIKSDIAFLDGTFFSKKEIPNRNLSKIPHPFVLKSIKHFNTLPKSQKNKIHFIHFNHTNPLLQPKNKERKFVLKSGFNLAREKQTFFL